jgi:predicted MPP superfamily phosphohydrolase
MRWTGGVADSLRFGFFIGAAVAAFGVFVRGVVKPLHEEGWFQPLTAFLNSVDRLIQLPGTSVANLAGFSPGLYTPARAWLAGVVANGAIYGLAAFLLRALWRRAVRTGGQAASADRPAEVLSRRRFLGRGLKVLGGGAAAWLGYMVAVEPRWFGTSHRVIRLRGLPAALDGLRAVQLTDIHHGPWMSLEQVRQVVRTANELEPDLVLLTGDYVDQSWVYIRPVAQELARLRPRIATVAVLGNHDWREGGPLVQSDLTRAGALLLDNTHRVLTPDRRLVPWAAEGLALAGVGDLWNDRQDYDGALGGLPQVMPRLLLSHNPDVAEEPGLVDSGLRVDLMVSGHTHGGQVRLPLLGSPMIPSRYGQKYAQGLVQGPVCPVFVCRGVGVSGLPVRLGAFPEIAVLEFRRA